MREHLSTVIPEVEIIETPTADYCWRVVVTKNAFKKAVTNSIDLIDYDNFKNSVEGHDLHEAYSQVWGVMHRLQYMDKPQDITPLDRSFAHNAKEHDNPYAWQETDG